MFKNVQNQFKQLQMLQRLMKDENFRALISHPKVQALMQDKAFQQAVQSRDAQKIGSHPKLLALRGDPEVAPLMAKLKPEELLKGMA